MTARRLVLRRLLAAVLLAAAAGVVALALRSAPAARASDPADAAGRVDRDTRFQYVAVFPAGTGAVEIEAWRRQVLVRSHRERCFHGWPCLARLLRLSGQGAAGAELLAFDLQADTPARERAAVLAAALRTAPLPVLFADTSPALAAAGVAPPLTHIAETNR